MIKRFAACVRYVWHTAVQTQIERVYPDARKKEGICG